MVTKRVLGLLAGLSLSVVLVVRHVRFRCRGTPPRTYDGSGCMAWPSAQATNFVGEMREMQVRL